MHARSTRRLVAVTLFVLVLGGCSGDTDDADGTDATTADAAGDDTSEASDTAAEAGDDADDATEDAGDATEDVAASSDGTEFFAVEPTVGEGTGTVTFADGTELSTPITCTIGQRELAGRELLYTATSSGDVQFDMTVYGDGGAVGSVVLNLTDGTGQRSSAGGPLAAGPFELTEVGPTIAGAGTFKPGHAGDTDAEGEPREGDVRVECS